MDTLIIPVDDASLRLIDEALGATLEDDGTGNPKVIGAEFTMSRLLGFWSGEASHDDIPVLLTRDDIIRALIDEIRRLR